MAKMSESAVPSLLFTETANASIATPAAGKASLFRDTDNTWKDKDESGTVTAIGGTSGASADGWTSAAETWTYVSADGPTGVFSVAADVTTKYSVGMRVRYVQTTTKYGIVTAVSVFGGGITSITIYGGTDYTTANAAISANYYSTSKAPFGFPTSPAKWTQTATDSTTLSANPGTNTWANPGAFTISIPIGAWHVKWEAVVDIDGSGANNQWATLSTANNSESDSGFTFFRSVTGRIINSAAREKALLLAAKTSYFLNLKNSSGDPGFTDLRGDLVPTLITARCAYL